MSEDIKKDKLTPKQQRFVAAVSTGIPAKEAVIQAGYKVTSDASASSLATTMLNSEKIQNALALAIEIDYPNVTKRTAQTIMEVLDNPDVRPADKLKAVEILIKVCGWQAPTKHASVNVSVRDKFKLPEE
jgi:phage terminase small subunit